MKRVIYQNGRFHIADVVAASIGGADSPIIFADNMEALVDMFEAITEMVSKIHARKFPEAMTIEDIEAAAFIKNEF